ncbi:Coactosin [Termitomyces sp. J132]|nr:Coactosin [Termitomyces sp. J132]
MADLSDSKIDEDIFRLICYCSSASINDPDNHLKAYQDVRSDKSDTNWLLLDYISDRADKLQVTQTGTGGLAELREVLDDTKASYAYARVTYSNDKESTREKFILVVWIGPHCKVMRKAKISVQAADVKKVLRVYSIEVAAEVKDDLKEDPIIAKLRKAGGASYDGV